jgi:short-subunit dehydrogenase
MDALAQRVAVITGATGGIGRSIALTLAAEGTTLCLTGRSREGLQALAQSARGNACRVEIYPADLTIDDDVRGFAALLRRDFAQIDLLIHSAGAISIGALDNAPVEDLDWQYRVNVRAPYYVTQLLLPMLKQAKGQVVFFNSLVGLDGKAGSSQYSATKHALKGLADSLRQELNPHGIRVLTVFLGRTATAMQASVHRMEGRSYQAESLIQPDEVARVLMAALSLAPTAEVTDITIRHPIKLQPAQSGGF